jgi:hypothetical protein
MPIEFRCPKCDRLLRTPDGTSGKDAKCPQCGNIVRIPDAAGAAPQGGPAATPPVPPPPGAPPRPESSEAPFRDTVPYGQAANPYQSPQADQMQLAAGEVRRGFTPTLIDLGDVLGKTWRIYKANLWTCVLLALPLVLIGGGQNAYAYGRQGDFNASENAVGLILAVVQFFFTLGIVAAMLKVCRGQPVDAADLFSGAPVLLPALGSWLLVTVMVALGFCLLIVPGIIVGLMFSAALPLIVDQRVGVMDSLRMSREATSGNKLTLFALGLVAVLGGVLVIVLTCGLGAFFVQPLWLLLWVVCYLTMTGQSTIDEGAAP